MSHQTTKTLAAFALLVTGGFVLAHSLWDAGDEVPKEANSSEEFEADDMPPLDADPLSGLADITEPGNGDRTDRIEVDLLALYGSFDPTSDVQDAFATQAEFHAAPRGESVALATGRTIDWTGQLEPPRMSVSLVVIKDTGACAAVDGAVVRVGDRIAGGRVTQINEQGMQVSIGGLSLFYELQQPYPREFLPELARRGLALQDETPTPIESEDP
ncbi:MAG: hypothetical protein KDB80_10625 [Planctomycetes bacterium]|nr:hypothetical protein [Planctomycetota bacterium]